jgi:hypothetical protein
MTGAGFCPQGRFDADGRTLPDLRKAAPASANGKPLHYCIAACGGFPVRP